MKIRLIICVVAVAATIARCAADESESDGVRMHVSVEFLGIPKQYLKGSEFTGDGVQMEVTTLLENVGTKRLTLPTSSYDGYPSCFTTNVKFREICFSVGPLVSEGKRVKPSPAKFAPVSLEPGEFTMFSRYTVLISEEQKDKLQSFAVRLDVDCPYAAAYDWWSGSLRKSVDLAQAKAKKPNQSPQPPQASGPRG